MIAEFYGAPYAVATDCCTHAIELSLRHTGADLISVPTHTYISVPFTAEKLNIKYVWSDLLWEYYYYITNNIIDAAVLWQRNSYIPKTYMCLSFQFKKHLSLGRGGAILCESKKDYIALKKLSYDGRLPDLPWAEQNIDSMGFHYYMTPETAQQGIEKLPEAIETIPIPKGWQDYPNLTQNSIFKKH